MKIDLLFENNKVVELDLEKIQEKIKKFNNFLKRNQTFKDLSLEVNSTSKNEYLDKKNITQSIFSLIDDLQHNINFRELYNIIIKNNPNNKAEEDIVNLSEGLSVFLKNKKIIHQNNVFMLYNIISQSGNKTFQSLPFRKGNINQWKDQITFKIVDYNKIPSLFDQLMFFINSKNSFAPWINMQIIHIHNLAISPFEDKNILFSKILSIWYWLTYGSQLDELNFPIQTYLEVLKLNSTAYLEVIKECLKTGNYTDFIDFIIDNVTRYQKQKNLTLKINQFLRRKNRIYLAEYEEKFLFVIIYYQLDEFDWKIFKKITKWASSKQYIVRNLSKFVVYSLLSSKNLKNRKFFYQSRFLKKIISNFENELNQQEY